MSHITQGTTLNAAQSAKLFAILGVDAAQFRTPFKGVSLVDGERFHAGRIGGGLMSWNLTHDEAAEVFNADTPSQNPVPMIYESRRYFTPSDAIQVAVTSDTELHGGATVAFASSLADGRPWIVGLYGFSAPSPFTPRPSYARAYGFVKAAAAFASEIGQADGFGLWTDNGLLYADAIRFVATREEAEALGRDYGQKAIFNIETGETVYL